MVKSIDLTDAALDTRPWEQMSRAVIEFWSFRCEACRHIAILMNGIGAINQPDVGFFKANVDKNPYLTAHFDVPCVPALYVFENSATKDVLLGAWSAGDVEKFF